jgi:hypothetical protein
MYPCPVAILIAESVLPLEVVNASLMSNHRAGSAVYTASVDEQGLEVFRLREEEVCVLRRVVLFVFLFIPRPN